MSSSSRLPSLSTFVQEIGFSTWFFLLSVLLPFLCLQLPSFSPYTSLFILCPQWVYSEKHEFYRLVSAAFMHGSVQHLGMNSLALVTLGYSLEKQLGTAAFMSVTLVALLFGGGLYVGIDYFYGLCTSAGNEINCVVGFSGVLFTYLTILSGFGPSERRVFCIPGLKSWFIPWIFLLFTQIIAPNVSFTGHLSGILVGLMINYRILSIFLPNYSWITAFEHFSAIKWLETHMKWRFIPAKSHIHSILSCSSPSTPLLEVPYNRSAGTELV